MLLLLSVVANVAIAATVAAAQLPDSPVVVAFARVIASSSVLNLRTHEQMPLIYKLLVTVSSGLGIKYNSLTEKKIPSLHCALILRKNIFRIKKKLNTKRFHED